MFALLKGALIKLLNIVLLKLAYDRGAGLADACGMFLDFLPLDFLFDCILDRILGFKGGYFLFVRFCSNELCLKIGVIFFV